MEEKLITVAALPYSRAHILEGRLEAEGIECYLKNINLVQSTVGDGVRLVVREKDAGRALEYLSELQRVELEAKLKGVKIKPVRKILVPVDFSDASLNACYYSLNMAAKLGADLRLLNAYNIPEIRPMPFDESDFYQGTLAVHLRELKKQAEHDMKEFIGKLRQQRDQSGISGVDIEKILVTGYPAEAILQVAETMRTDLVVMGLESVKNYTFAPVGDIVAKVVSELKVPALVIPSNFVYKGGLSTMSKVLYATDFEEADYYSIHRLMNFVAPFNVEIHCVHIGEEDAVAWDKIRMHELEGYIVRGFGKVKVRSAILQAKNVEEGLNQYIDENQIELMAVTTRDRNLFSRLISPSITRKILVHSNIPLLVFHAGRRE